MKGFRYQRGIMGDVTGQRGAEIFPHYRFEFDVPPYDWSLDQKRGEEFEQLIEEFVGKALDVIKSDAKKLDVPLGFLIDSASCSFSGIGARDITETGDPDWQDALYDEDWNNVNTYERAVILAKASARNIGDNYVANKIILSGVPFPKSAGKDSKPFFLIWKKWVWSVNSQDLQYFGANAKKFFDKANMKWRNIIFEKAKQTRLRKERSERAKEVWRVRKRNKRIKEAFERAERVAKRKQEKRHEAQMYRELMALVNAEALRKSLRLQTQRKAKKAAKTAHTARMYRELMALVNAKAMRLQTHRKGKK